MKSPDSAADEAFMNHALNLALRAWGETHPNPMVGAIIVEQGRVVAEGWHERAGGPHAEVSAFKALGHRPRRDATLYVTMEPCSTPGKTGACTDVIIERGIRRVVVGATDPNPMHAGRGFSVLREAGVEVVTGVLGELCEDINLIFNHWIGQGTPFFAAKVGLTLDGKIATRTGHSRWVTGPEARQDVMRWRRLFPAVAVGAGTVLADDPELTARHPDVPSHCPRRLIFDRKLRVASHLDCRLLCDQWHDHTVVITKLGAPASRLRALEKAGVECWEFPTEPPQAFYEQLRKRCAEAGLTGVLIEGGSGLLSDLLSECQLDYLFAYRAPKLLADERALPAFRGLNTSEMADAISLLKVHHAILGEDILTRGHVFHPEEA